MRALLVAVACALLAGCMGGAAPVGGDGGVSDLARERADAAPACASLITAAGACGCYLQPCCGRTCAAGLYCAGGECVPLEPDMLGPLDMNPAPFDLTGGECAPPGGGCATEDDCCRAPGYRAVCAAGICALYD